MAERLLDRPECLTSHSPALSDEAGLREARLVDVEDPLAGHELVDELQCKLLALVAATDAVDSKLNGSRFFEL